MTQAKPITKHMPEGSMLDIKGKKLSKTSSSEPLWTPSFKKVTLQSQYQDDCLWKNCLVSPKTASIDISRVFMADKSKHIEGRKERNEGKENRKPSFLTESSLIKDLVLSMKENGLVMLKLTLWSPEEVAKEYSWWWLIGKVAWYGFLVLTKSRLLVFTELLVGLKKDFLR